MSSDLVGRIIHLADEYGGVTFHHIDGKTTTLSNPLRHCSELAIEGVANKTLTLVLLSSVRTVEFPGAPGPKLNRPFGENQGYV
jgi:hypothetical protein